MEGMTQIISSTAATARENARSADGKFGTQARAEADLELAPATGSVQDLLAARDASLVAVTEAPTPQEDRDASALLQRQSAKLAGIGVPLDFPGATRLEIVQDFDNGGYRTHAVLGADGTVLADRAAIENYDSYLGRGFDGNAEILYDELANSFVIDHDSWIDDVAQVTTPSARDHASIVIDLEKAAAMDASATTVVTEPELIAHQEQARAAREARREAEQLITRATRTGVELIARVHPSAVRAQFSIQDEDSEPESVALYDAAGAQIPEHVFDETSLFEDLDQRGLDAMREVNVDYYNDSADYEIDLTAIRAAMEPRP